MLRRSFHRDFQAIDNISFHVETGQTLGIIGQNGAGKSTLLKLLTGVLMPDSGEIRIDGRITGLLELGTGFNSEFSGVDNIFLNGTYIGLSRDEIKARLNAIVEFTELGRFIDEPIKTYSSGMVMRLAFSVAIHAEPKCFVVDEALSVGDAYFQQKCMRKIRSLKESGGSIVFVSHDLNAVKMLCNQAMLLENGRVVESGDPEPVINTYNFLIANRSSCQESEFKAENRLSGYGNYKVTIDSVQLVNEAHRLTEILSSAQPAGVVIRLTGRETVADMTLGIVIRDKFGQDIYGTNSFYLQQKISIQQGQHLAATYFFDEFNIGPGKYSISAALHTGPSHADECFHWKDKSCVFEVVAGGDHPFIGLVRLKPVLRIEPVCEQGRGAGS
ncbi:MAG: ABC transporter ATP-binding protein [Desulfobacterales bacterium]|nr:ABC transporter ATP-binding protein [Desulfobacterales bacterium]